MHTRRRVLAVVGATVLAGCSSEGSQSANQQPETTNETQSQADAPDLTAGEIHDDWIGIEDNAYPDAVEVASEAYEQAVENGDIYEGLTQGLQAVNQELGYMSTSDIGKHKNMVAALQQATPDNLQLYSTFEQGKSAVYNESEWPVTRIWLEQDTEDQDTIDIITALSRDANNATHRKNTDPDNPSTGVEELQAYRNPQISITYSPHDIEAFENLVEYNEKEHDSDYSEEDLEEGRGSRLDRFNSMFWGEGIGLPVEGHWEEYHSNIHSVHPKINRKIANTDEIGEGDVAAFTVDDGDVTLYSTVSEYDPEQDGLPTQDEIKQI